MAGPSICNSNTLCACCRSLMETHGPLQQLCNCADLNGEKKANVTCPLGIKPTLEPVTIVPLTGNPYFTCIVTKGQLRHPFHLAIPKRFYSFLPYISVPIVLTCGKRSWGMWYDGHLSTKRILRGWKQFVIDNNLKSGDGCVYELLDTENLMFRVQILSGHFPCELTDDATDLNGEKKTNVTCPQGIKPSLEPVTIVPLTGNPYFTCIVTKGQLRSPFHLAIPKRFYSFLPYISVPIVLTCGKRSWGMWYDGHLSTKRILRGWKQFVIDNNLKSGDGCVYELLDRENLMFRVQILSGHIPSELTDDATDLNNEEQKVGTCAPDAMRKIEPVTSELQHNIIGTCAPDATSKMESTSEFQHNIVPLTQNPFFTCIVTKSQLQRPFQLTVPGWFSLLLPDADVPVTLTCRKRSWNLLFDGHKSRKRFRRGWKQFVIDNNLKLGDGCVYELIDRESLNFKVQILSGDVPSQLKQVIGKSIDVPIMIN